MQQFDPKTLKKLYNPPSDSHKGQNGKLMLIGGSHLFHAASLWALTVASRIVDMVFYSSVPENNAIVHETKKSFHDGIVVPRDHVGDYIEEAECVLIGPGMVRTDVRVENGKLKVESLSQINSLRDEGEQTYALTKYLLEKYPHKQWVIDGGALQMIDPEWMRPLDGHVLLTPHLKEFKRVFGKEPTAENVQAMAKRYNTHILLKGEVDYICSPTECIAVKGGNPGMTKGGTGDVLAGLVAALACKNDLFLAAQAGSYINKKAGERLSKRVGNSFNASDLANEIPTMMKELLVF